MNFRQAALTFAAACITAATASANTFIVTASGFSFSPQDIQIEVGDTVEWQWVTLSHTVTEGSDGTFDGDEAFHSDLDAGTPIFSLTFDAAFVSANPRPGGVYDYFCVPHFPIMVGTVTVLDGPGTPYCFGDGIDTVVTAGCPCGNTGNAGHGCANSNALLGGAQLFASGTTSPNTVLFTCVGIPNNNLSTFLRGTMDTPAGAVFGDGIKCASGVVVRFGQQTAGQGGNPANSVVSSTTSVVAGNTRYYQVHYRNPNAGFCPPELFNVSSGYVITW